MLCTRVGSLAGSRAPFPLSRPAKSCPRHFTVYPPPFLSHPFFGARGWLFAEDPLRVRRKEWRAWGRFLACSSRARLEAPRQAKRPAACRPPPVFPPKLALGACVPAASAEPNCGTIYMYLGAQSSVLRGLPRGGRALWERPFLSRRLWRRAYGLRRGRERREWENGGIGRSGELLPALFRSRAEATGSGRWGLGSCHGLCERND